MLSLASLRFLLNLTPHLMYLKICMRLLTRKQTIVSSVINHLALWSPIPRRWICFLHAQWCICKGTRKITRRRSTQKKKNGDKKARLIISINLVYFSLFFLFLLAYTKIPSVDSSKKKKKKPSVVFIKKKKRNSRLWNIYMHFLVNKYLYVLFYQKIFICISLTETTNLNLTVFM